MTEIICHLAASGIASHWASGEPPANGGMSPLRVCGHGNWMPLAPAR